MPVDWQGAFKRWCVPGVAAAVTTAVYLNDVRYCFKYLSEYYEDDSKPEDAERRAEEDRQILANYVDDCSPLSVVDKEKYEAAIAHLAAQLSKVDPKEGIFAPDHMTIITSRESISFLGGARATFLQLAHPFVAQGIKMHSTVEQGVQQRFFRTFHYMFAILFGTKARCFTLELGSWIQTSAPR